MSRYSSANRPQNPEVPRFCGIIVLTAVVAATLGLVTVALVLHRWGIFGIAWLWVPLVLLLAFAGVCFAVARSIDQENARLKARQSPPLT